MTDNSFIPKPILRTQTEEGRDIQFLIIWFDFWVGIYFDPKNQAWYICPLPCCVFYIGRRASS